MWACRAIIFFPSSVTSDKGSELKDLIDQCLYYMSDLYGMVLGWAGVQQCILHLVGSLELVQML